MKAFVVVALVVGVAGSARAESEARGPWFVGANVHYIRDGRVGYIRNFIHDGPTGLGYGLEGGRTVLPWLSVALTYRLASLSEDVWVDPGTAEFTERQHRLGVRIDLWPVEGRLRLGAALVRSWRRSQMAFSSPTVVYVDRTADNTYELSLGVVPVRWRNFELEIAGTFSREPSVEASLDGQDLSTFSLGLGLRWHSDGPAR